MKAEFTDFEALMALTLPFDQMFPGVRLHNDRLFYHLGLKMGDSHNFTFGEFHERAKLIRSKRTIKIDRSPFQLGLIALVLFQALERAAIRFPETDRYCDRVMWEITLATQQIEGFPQFDSLKREHAVFEQFHLDHRMRRRVFSSKVKGVG